MPRHTNPPKNAPKPQLPKPKTDQSGKSTSKPKR